MQENEEDVTTKKHSAHVTKTLAARKTHCKVDPHLEEQFLTGRLYGTVDFYCALHSVWFKRVLCCAACVSSRPGQSGRCDGYLLEGRELEFYLKKLKSKKAK